MIIFSEHSELKLQQRNIRKSLVIEAIENPDINTLGYSDRQIAYKKFGKLYLKVVFTKANGNYTIITQHWDKKFKPKKNED